jgi:predicted dehydrogenase
MSRLRIALVGAGTGRGQSWMSTLKKLSERSECYDFCALCDVFPEKARESAERWGVQGYTNLLEMLDGSGPAVILNGAPGDANVMAVGVAAHRRMHVVTEIPIAPTCGLADLLIETCADNGVVLEVTEQVWMWAHEQLKRKIIAAGLIGEPQHARMVYTNKADYHGINGVRMLIGGRPTRVLGYTKEVTVPAFSHYIDDGRTYDRWDHAVIEFDNGMTCLFESPPRGRMGPRWDIEGTLGQLVGSDLYIGSPDRFRHYPFITETAKVGEETVLDHIRVDTDPPVVFENPHKALGAADYDEVARMDILLGFHAAVTQGTPLVYGPEQARIDIEVLSAMRESHDRGNVWVDLPLTGPTRLEREIEAKFVEAYGDPREPEKLAGANFRQGGTRYWVANWE